VCRAGGGGKQFPTCMGSTVYTYTDIGEVLDLNHRPEEEVTGTVPVVKYSNE